MWPLVVFYLIFYFLLFVITTSIFLYACESWTLTAELQRRIQAMGMRCYHKILYISCIDHITNEEVRAKIQLAIGSYKDLLTQTAVVWSCLSFITSGQNHLARHRERGKEDKADRGRGGKTTSGNEQAWNSASPRGQWRTGKNGGNWLQNNPHCPNNSCG